MRPRPGRRILFTKIIKKNFTSLEPLELRIAPATFTVSTTADSGAGSFRQAILDANGVAGVDSIVFSFAAGSFPVITPLLALPVITGDVVIDAALAVGAAPEVVLDGVSAGASAVGLAISGSNVTVSGLVIHRFGSHGIRVNGSANVILNNYIGTDVAGMADFGNGGDGIIIESGTGNTVGAGNAISGNTGTGVHLAFGSTVTTVTGSKIGVNKTASAALANANGVVIDGDSGGNFVVGNLISGNVDYGIKVNSTVNGSTSAPTQFIQGNFVGTGAGGVGNLGNGKSGVYLLSVMAVRVGGTSAGEGNIISGNGTYGVEINSGSRHQLYANTIGLDSTGGTVLANGQTGVYVNGGSLNLIGSTTTRNIISGNGLHGVHILAGGSGNTLLGNYIGTDKTGAVALGNTGDGVRVQSVTNTTIGGAGTNAGNVISGNGGDGVFISGATSVVNTVLRQNYIGTTAAGTGDIGNVGNGINLSNVTGGATIGGSGSGAGNVIAGNGQSGILMSTTTSLTILGNTIGRSDAPNARGILVTGVGGTIGGVAAGEGNHISFNTGAGIAVTVSGMVALRGNSLHDNGGLGIDLVNNGVTPNDTNDADSGPNGLLNFPVLTAAENVGNSTTVSGTYAGLASTALTLDFYSNTTNGEAETYLGSTTVTTDAMGTAAFSQAFSAVPGGRTISATASIVSGTPQTSEVSALITPTVAISVGDVTLTEGSNGTKNFVFTVSLAAALVTTMTVDFATANGTALAGGDYVATAGTLTFTPGETTKTVTVPVLGDLTVEQSETFFLNLSNAVGATLVDAQGLGTITNDDAALATINDVTITEGDSGTRNMVFTVSLSTSSASAITLDFATTNGTALAGGDYAATAGTVTFAPGETTKTITVVVSGDLTVEANETLFLNLSNAVGAAISDAQGLGTITNDDTALVTVNDVTITEGDSGTKNMVFTVSLSTSSASAITLDFATTNGTALAGGDYAATAGTVTFAPGETTKTITVVANGDLTVEANETLFLNLSNAVGAAISDAQGLGTITNDDTALVTVNDVTITEGNSGTKNMVFTVSLSTSSASAITLDFTTADGTALVGSDYAAAAGTLTFAPGETTKTVAIVVSGDTTAELAETLFLNLSNASGATFSDAQGLGTILNDDVPSLSIADVTALESGAFTFTVTLSELSPLAVSVDYATVAGTATAGVDFTSASATLTIPAGQMSGQFTVLVASENLVETDELFTVFLGNAANATIADDSALATIQNDDATALVATNIYIDEGDSGISDAVFIVTLTAPSATDITFDFATRDGSATAGSDYLAISGSHTIPAGATSTQLTVSVIGDALLSIDEFFVLEITNVVGAEFSTPYALGFILNDEGPVMLTVLDSSVREALSGVDMRFTVQLSSGLESDFSAVPTTVEGTAVSPMFDGDFLAGAGGVTIAAGNTSGEFTVRILDDFQIEPSETFTVTFSNVGSLVGIDRGTATGTILDNDYFFDIGGGTFSENGDYSFTVTRSGATDTEVLINYETREGSATADVDFPSRSGTIVFAPGDTEVTLTFPTSDDSLIEETEHFFVDLSEGGTMNLIGQNPIHTGTAQITILDDDGPTVLIEAATPLALEDGTGDAGRFAFTISLSHASTLPITVRLRTTMGTASADDIFELDDVITFAPGQTIFAGEVSIKSDRFAEVAETFSLGISEAENALLGTASVALSITDNDGIIISKNRKTATWRDLDGDLVTLKVTKPVLTKELFNFRFGEPIDGAPTLAGQLLESLDLTTLGVAAKGMSLKFSAKRKDFLGNGFVNVGAVNAAGINLGAVAVAGDLGKIVAGAIVPGTGLKKLTVRSLGVFGTTTQAAGGDLISTVSGKLGLLKVAEDMSGATLSFTGTSTITIGGSVENADIRAGVVSALKVRGAWTASDFSASRIASIIIGGAVNGTVAAGDTFEFVAGKIASMKVAGAKLPLTRGPDHLTIGATMDVLVREGA